MISMIGHNMAFTHHSSDEIWFGFNQIAYDKKGGRGIVLFQCIQNWPGVAVIIASGLVLSGYNILLMIVGIFVGVIIIIIGGKYSKFKKEEN